MEGKKRGQPKKEPTELINFRIEKSLKGDLKLRFGRELNKMFKEWAKSLLSKTKTS